MVTVDLIMEFEEVMKRYVEIYGEDSLEDPTNVPMHYIRVYFKEGSKAGFVDGFMFDNPISDFSGNPSYVNMCLLMYNSANGLLDSNENVDITGPNIENITRIDKLIDESDLISMLNEV
jgi:hypothetical protein